MNSAKHNKIFSQYFEHYAQHETQIAAELFSHIDSLPSYRHTFIIPAYNEDHSFIEAFFDCAQPTLLIIVVNQPDNSIDSNINQQLILWFESNFNIKAEQKHLCFLTQNSSSNLDILLVKRFKKELTIPASEGVGLARKIGADIASYLFQNDFLSHPWVMNTDADVSLNKDFFSKLSSLYQEASIKQSSAAIFNFQHASNKEANNAQHLATLRYELFLKYYRYGLEYAKSRYAYHTLGSCILLNVNDYVRVRGFPKRSAGEDFYLLNKLNKINGVVPVEDISIEIYSRDSLRTPFGTGAAVKKIENLSDAQEQYLYYHPDCFEILKSVLSALEKLSVDNTILQIKQTIKDKINDRDLKFLQLEKNDIINILETLCVFQAVQKITNNAKNETQFQHQLFIYFDAFKTLKFIHALELTGLKRTDNARISIHSLYDLLIKKHPSFVAEHQQLWDVLIKH